PSLSPKQTPRGPESSMSKLSLSRWPLRGRGLALCALFSLLGCSTTTPDAKLALPGGAKAPEAPAPTPAAATTAAVAVAPAGADDSALPLPIGLAASAMDLKVDPCTDFYRYSCGGWLEATEIPADRSRWARSFNVIDEENQKTLRELLEATASGKAPAGMRYPRAVGDYYASCMDEGKLETAVPELKAEL